MAGDWTKLRNNLSSDPRVVSIAAATKLDRFAVVGRLHAIWAWAGEHTVDGRLPGATLAFVDELVGRKGFARAMAVVDWLMAEQDGLTMPRWDEHNSQSAKARATDNNKKARQRNGRAPAEFCPPPAGTDSPVLSRSDRDNHPHDDPETSGKCPDAAGTFTGTREELLLQQQQQHNARPMGGTTDPSPAGPPPDLPSLRARWPGIAIEAELRAAAAYCQREYGRSDVDLAWLEREWLPRARPRLAVNPSAGLGVTGGGVAEPEGWRSWLEDNAPGSIYAKGGAEEGREWRELDRTTQNFIAGGMAARKGAA